MEALEFTDMIFDKGIDKTYFLENFIEVGDKYVDNDFTKSCLNDEANKTVEGYFKEQCENLIKSTIASNPKMTYETASGITSIFGIPDFVLAQNGYTVTPNSVVINLTKTAFDNYKKSVVEEECKKVANAKANEFDYEVNNLTVREKQ